MLKNRKIILIYILAGITLFSVYKYIVTLREKYILNQDLARTQERVTLLEIEKQNLLQTIEKDKIWIVQLEKESGGLKIALRNNEERIFRLKDDLSKISQAVEQLNVQFSTLRAQNSELTQQNDKFKQQITALSLENAGFKARFNSIAELKNAIRELKRHGPTDAQAGNFGFMIKDGKTTFPAKVIIEVNPALNK